VTKFCAASENAQNVIYKTVHTWRRPYAVGVVQRTSPEAIKTRQPSQYEMYQDKTGRESILTNYW